MTKKISRSINCVFKIKQVILILISWYNISVSQ